MRVTRFITKIVSRASLFPPRSTPVFCYRLPQISHWENSSPFFSLPPFSFPPSLPPSPFVTFEMTENGGKSGIRTIGNGRGVFFFGTTSSLVQQLAGAFQSRKGGKKDPLSETRNDRIPFAFHPFPPFFNHVRIADLFHLLFKINAPRAALSVTFPDAFYFHPPPFFSFFASPLFCSTPLSPILALAHPPSPSLSGGIDSFFLLHACFFYECHRCELAFNRVNLF